MQFVKEYIYLSPPLHILYCGTMKECSVCHLPVIQAVTLSLELAVASSLEQAFFLFPFCMEVKLLYFSLISIKKKIVIIKDVSSTLTLTYPVLDYYC